MKTHPLNVSYLVVGLVLLGIAGSWALRASGVIDLDEIQWLLPLTLVAAGVIGLVAFAARGLTGRGTPSGQTEPEDGFDDYSGYDSHPTTENHREGDPR